MVDDGVGRHRRHGRVAAQSPIPPRFRSQELEPCRGYPVVRLIHARIRIEPWIDHEPVDEVLHDSGNVIYATEPIVERWFLLRRPGSFARSPSGSVVITQRGQGPVMLKRTASPIATVRPIQAFSTKSFTPLAVSTTIFGRNRRTSKRPGGYSSRSRSTVAVVSRWMTAQSKNVPSGAGRPQPSTVAAPGSAGKFDASHSTNPTTHEG
jgi:hypothetical protein